MSKISKGARSDIERQLDMWLDSFGTHFGEQLGGGACEGELQGLLLSAELHKELARCALAFAAKHGLETTITQGDVDESIDECIEITKESMADEDEDEEEAPAGTAEAAFDMAAFEANSSRWQNFQQFVWEEMKAADPTTPFYKAVDAAIPRFHVNQPVAEADRAAFSE